MRKIVLLGALAALNAPSDAAAQDGNLARIDALDQQISEAESVIAAARAELAAIRSHLASGGVAPVAPAQNEVAQVAAVVEPDEPTRDSSAVVAAPPGRVLQPSGSAIQVSAASGSSEVSISLSDIRSETRPNQGGRSSRTGIRSGWTLTATAPLAKDVPRTDLATFDSLRSDIELSLAWSRYGRFLRIPGDDAITLRAREACRNRPNGPTDAECDAGGGGAFINDHLGADAERAYLASIFGDATAYGFEGTIGWRDAEYTDAATFTSRSQSDVPWGFKGYFAFIRSLETSWIFSAEYQNAPDDQDEGVLCPAATAAPTLCLNGPIGAPELNERFLTSVEWRSVIEAGSFLGRFGVETQPFALRLGMAPSLTWDHSESEYAVDVPVYLVGDTNGSFTAGVRLGYRSDKDDWIAGVFVGTPFSLRPQ
jgi:hypothetical protein